jgi:NAD(P)-dependent dehydrogenase (short-subunit alcohol dehydrogenase family)
VVDLTVKSFSRIDSLIINHGALTPIRRIGASTPEEWRTLYDINFFSAISFVCSLLYTRCPPLTWRQIIPALPFLRKTQGRIILTSSGAATGAYSTWGAYGSSKAALNHLAMTLAVEEPDITTVSIRPGTVDTDMQLEIRRNNSVMDEKDAKKFKSLHEEGKLLRPEQPGNVMARLAVEGDKGLSGKFLT